jgi:hypothetical protein
MSSQSAMIDDTAEIDVDVKPDVAVSEASASRPSILRETMRLRHVLSAAEERSSAIPP